jgi:hypothetical protein
MRLPVVRSGALERLAALTLDITRFCDYCSIAAQVAEP